MLSCDGVQACIPLLRGPVLGGDCGIRRIASAQQKIVPSQVLQCVLKQPSKPNAAHQIRFAIQQQTCDLLTAWHRLRILMVFAQQIPRTLRN